MTNISEANINELLEHNAVLLARLVALRDGISKVLRERVLDEKTREQLLSLLTPDT